MSDNENGIKPCPFCGSPGFVHDIIMSPHYYVSCGDKKCPAFNVNTVAWTKQKAIEKWNKRA